MKRKEVGGIADDLVKKGVNTEERRDLRSESVVVAKINDLTAQITLANTNIKQQRESELNKLKANGIELNSRLRDVNDSLKAANANVEEIHDDFKKKIEYREHVLSQIQGNLNNLKINDVNNNEIMNLIGSKCSQLIVPTETKVKELQFNERSQCISNPNDFEGETKELIEGYQLIGREYVRVKNLPLTEVDTTKLENQLDKSKRDLLSLQEWNKEAVSINSLFDWKDANTKVKELQNNFYMKLTEIDTGVKGLHIAPESRDSQNIFLMYDGSYDPAYFYNENKELRKLSAYSDTQKPLICLLIQSHLLSKKGKTLPYLWIDKVPIDNKTKELLEKMSEELGLWLIVSWTGDFKVENLEDGDLLLEGGDIFFNNKTV